MIRYLRILLLALAALVLVVLALANRAPVPVRLLPDGLAALTGLTAALTVPVWLVGLAGLLAGLLLGLVLEWVREHGHRVAARSGKRQVRQLERELAVMKDSSGLPDDDVLALLNKPDRR